MAGRPHGRSLEPRSFLAEVHAYEVVPYVNHLRRAFLRCIIGLLSHIE